MANSEGKLSQDDIAKVITHLTEKTKNKHTCPVCAASSWNVGEHMLSGDIYRGGRLILGGLLYPQVFVICNNCMHMQIFAALPLGVYVEEEVEKPPDAREKKAEGGSNV